MKEKFRTVSFWLSLGASIVLVLDCLSQIFGFAVRSEVVQMIIATVCSVLVLLGVVTKRDLKDSKELTPEELLEEIKISSDDIKKK